MADPEAARLTQLRNIQVRTGQSIAQLHAAIAASGLVKVGERRSWAMEKFSLGYGDANALALSMGKPLPDLGDGPSVPPDSDSDPLDALYTGAKAGLRPLHDAVMQALQAFGPFEVAPKKGYVSLRRKRQFAMIGPATKDLVEMGFNAKGLAADPRLKVLPPGGMCNCTVRLGSVAEVDAALLGWARTAYEAAG